MNKVEYGKKYKLSCYDYELEGIYLGQKQKKNLINKHFILVNNNENMQNYFFLISAENLEIIEENKLKVIASKMNFTKLSKLEAEFLGELGRKYWGQDL